MEDFLLTIMMFCTGIILGGMSEKENFKTPFAIAFIVWFMCWGGIIALLLS